MDLSKFVDKKTTLIGKISDVPWQHMIASVKTHPNIYYFDLEDKNQIVIYARTTIAHAGKISITGKIIAVKGGSKRPGAAKSEPYTEYHMLVDEWKPVD
nr:hypothetical protein [Candidatus Sigynarchaeota archaeon]